jgi:uncharacterized protein YyaL (SSP411 family)
MSAHLSPNASLSTARQTPAHTNALIHEKSPYLLQHAHNPVNWRAWNDETFAIARKEGKPIFLSIGYATCHWCHVMERESFENEEIARYINERFIAIKVDREERPDIDALYMKVCQATTGHGGWPLTIFMTPEKEPFFAGTYFPPANYRNRPGFPYVLKQIYAAWTNEREKVVESAQGIIEHLRAQSSQNALETLPNDILDQTFAQYEQRFDPVRGGFGAQPKFPSPQNFLFLLRYYRRTGATAARVMVETTLKAMRQGGIFDHLGYGFHRYSTDRDWLLPHFEKMLYDQAMLALAYIETYQVGGDEFFADVAEEIFTYVLRDMTSPEGGFYSAEDADSEGREGKFYVWTTRELEEVLGKEDAELFAEAYSFAADGNFHDEATGAKTGENIPHLRESFERIVERISAGGRRSMDVAELRARLSVMRERLFAARETRERPLKDDKILADWNGLMIAAFALGARVLDNALYTQAAEKALDFILSAMTAPRRDDGDSSPAFPRLLHRYRAGEAAVPAFLDDYAFLAFGALELYQTTFATRHLETALCVAREMIRLFYDAESGRFRFSAADNERLPTESCEAYDGALPSGNSMAACVLARLGALTSNADFTRIAEETTRAFGRQIMSYPTGFAQMLIAHDFLTGNAQELILAGKPNDGEIHRMIRVAAETYAPHLLTALNHAPNDLARFIEQASYQTEQNNRATAYLCEGFVCKEPIFDAETLRAALTERFKCAEALKETL